MWCRVISGFLLATLIPAGALCADVSGLLINEFSANSDGSFPDEDGDNSDWIELRNAGGATISTGGYFLTDDPDQSMLWELPAIDIPAGGLLTVFASGKDRAVAGAELHTNFSLTADGEYLALIAPDGVTPACEFAPAYPRQFFGLSYGSAIDGAASEETFIDTPAAATWFVPTSDIGDTWRDIGFDDNSWSVAQTGIGYGSGYDVFIGTDGNIQNSAQGVNEGVYIRVPFQVTDATGVQSLGLSILFEDGFVAFLNGEEVASENVPATVEYDTPATANEEVEAEDDPFVFDLDFAGKLVDGENILAIHLLNVSRTSSDILVVPELRGETVSGDTITGYIEVPTPGAPNTEVNYIDFVRDTSFDIDRGFFEAPFDVTISCPTPGATLVYTLDANSPTLTNGTVVVPPDGETPPQVTIGISTTTVVRAAAFKDGLRPTNIDTQTYFFLEDVLDQSDTPLPGYPLPWRQRNGNTINGDYGMDPDIIGPIYSRQEVKDALTSLPTVSVVTDIANLFDQQIGIQVNPQDAGEGSERPISVELIGFEDAPASQLDAGMRMNGNASRNPSRPKHNFRVIHRNEYGTGRLQYPLFGNDASVDRFNQWILRGGNGNSWIHPSASVYNNAMYIRDQWFRDAHTAMGYPEALQREVHVYFNGLYWGMHHLFERIEEEWAAERFGGDEDDWEGFRIVGGNNIEVINGTPSEVSNRMLLSWRATLDAALAGDLEGVKQYLDLDAFIDYILLNFHAGNNDWDQNNVRAMRRINPPGKYMFFCHDAERAGLNALNTANVNINVTTKNTTDAPTSINWALRNNTEYAIRFADRAQKHLFNGGALTPENGMAQWAARADGIREAMKAESARWGDFRGNPPRTLVQWEAALQREYTQWFPLRTPITISQLRAIGLYPNTEPPAFSQHGGFVAPGFGLQITNVTGDVYYTTDGSDPRLEGGAINPAATQVPGTLVDFTMIPNGSDWKYEDTGTDLGTAWRAPDFNDDGWAAGPAPLGYGIITNTTIATMVNSLVDRYNTVYFRREFELSDANLITEATVKVKADGGSVIYINGTEAVRDDMPDGEITYDTFSELDTEEDFFDIYTIDHTLLVEGTNSIAVEVHNGGPVSSDMVLDLILEGVKLNDANSLIPINATTTVRARSLDGNDWSALTEATFLTGVAAAADNLAISELHYHPSTDQGDLAEFLELANIGDAPVNLAGVTFTQGINFSFDDSATLAPGERALLIADATAFEAAHGAGHNVIGTYTGRLANDGERLTLSAGDGSAVQSFRYNDRAPWPEEADGNGYSLVLIAPESAPRPRPGQQLAREHRPSRQPRRQRRDRVRGRPGDRSAGVCARRSGCGHATDHRRQPGDRISDRPRRGRCRDRGRTFGRSFGLGRGQRGISRTVGSPREHGHQPLAAPAGRDGPPLRQIGRLASRVNRGRNQCGDLSILPAGSARSNFHRSPRRSTRAQSLQLLEGMQRLEIDPSIDPFARLRRRRSEAGSDLSSGEPDSIRVRNSERPATSLHRWSRCLPRQPRHCAVPASSSDRKRSRQNRSDRVGNSS